MSKDKEFELDQLISAEHIRRMKDFYKKIKDNANFRHTGELVWSSNIEGNPTKSMMTHAFKSFLRIEPESYLDYGSGNTNKRMNVVSRGIEYFKND